jgi:hypothetical protein
MNPVEEAAWRGFKISSPTLAILFSGLLISTLV